MFCVLLCDDVQAPGDWFTSSPFFFFLLLVLSDVCSGGHGSAQQADMLYIWPSVTAKDKTTICVQVG